MQLHWPVCGYPAANRTAARHYIWFPSDTDHFIQVGHTATAIRSVYFHTYDDHLNDFYTQMDIYPVTNLLHEMILYAGQWRGIIEPGSTAFTFCRRLKIYCPI
ncbi:hypothetical protein [Mucilaginibacter sp. CSA2-8R]|uniref:hypothetical protein n=1 Tax=Mucilaginibacter sp. CSA2-8R TaxID=3141542 RepID=UPI00315DACF5